MFTITFTFQNGSVGTLTHDSIAQIREWIRIFDNAEARDYCKIASIVVRENRQNNALSEVA